MNGGFCEGIDKTARLADIDEDTFVSFCEFCYTGDYSLPAPYILDRPMPEPPVEIQSSEKEKHDETPENYKVATVAKTGKDYVNDLLPTNKLIAGADRPFAQAAAAAEDIPCSPRRFRSHWQTLTARICRQRKPDKLSPSSVVRAVYIPLSKVPDPDSILGTEWARFRRESTPQADKPFFRPYKNTSPFEEYTEVFLSQARLYVFGDVYDVMSLRSLVIYKMRRILAEFTLFPSRVQDVYALIEYTFGNTREEDGFRRLILDYAVCMISIISEHRIWDSFYRENVSFASELIAKLRSLSVKEKTPI